LGKKKRLKKRLEKKSEKGDAKNFLTPETGGNLAEKCENPFHRGKKVVEDR